MLRRGWRPVALAAVLAAPVAAPAAAQDWKDGPPPPGPALMEAIKKGDEGYEAGRFAEARAEKVVELAPGTPQAGLAQKALASLK